MEGEPVASQHAQTAIDMEKEANWKPHDDDFLKTFAYLDDNDGKKEDCDCGFCKVQ